MGRNSVEAAKASLMRAVRARLAACTVGLTGFFGFLAVVGVVFAGLLAAGTGFFAVAVVAWRGFCVGFFFAVEEACPAGLVVELAEDCPATGSTTIKKESRPARQ
jgi:hypothetical protein